MVVNEGDVREVQTCREEQKGLPRVSRKSLEASRGDSPSLTEETRGDLGDTGGSDVDIVKCLTRPKVPTKEVVGHSRHGSERVSSTSYSHKTYSPT